MGGLVGGGAGVIFSTMNLKIKFFLFFFGRGVEEGVE